MIREGDVVVLSREGSGRYELAEVKAVRRDGSFAVWSHTGNTAAVAGGDIVHELANAHAFRISRLRVSEDGTGETEGRLERVARFLRDEAMRISMEICEEADRSLSVDQEKYQWRNDLVAAASWLEGVMDARPEEGSLAALLRGGRRLRSRDWPPDMWVREEDGRLLLHSGTAREVELPDSARFEKDSMEILEPDGRRVPLP